MDATNFTFYCPACGKVLTARINAVGTRTACPHCKISITVPAGLATGTAPANVPPPSLAMPAPAARATEPPSWRAVVHDNRGLVPLIECATGVGSGLLVSRDGLVVTNRHVVEGAPVFMLTFCDGSKAKAVVVHTHDHRDLAMLRAAIARDAAFDIEHNVASDPQAGDDVLAIGHPRGFAFTSTRGIVSETSRRLPDGIYLQTDVAINPGNSGGPLLDQNGKLVGLNTRIQIDAQGLGFAIGGEEVRAYVLYVLDLIRRRELHCPTDEEIAAAEKRLTPWDIVAAAAHATGLPHKRAALSDGQPFLSVLTPRHHAVMVTTGGNVFRAAGALAPALTENQRRDPDLLRRLLGWQSELCGPAFEFGGEDLLVVYKRSVQGMDVNEAREAILRVADALDALEKPVKSWLKRK